MQQSMPDGLYDQILTDELASELSKNFRDSEHTVGPLDAASATRRLADSLAEQLAGVFHEIGSVTVGDADPDKSGFHESIAYHDYAVSPDLFHWQSQNSAAPTTRIGKQYLESVGEQPNGWQFQLFVRTDPDSAYLACGSVKFKESQGARPMNITWRFEIPLPAAAFSHFSVLRVA